ncbi:hypothetical protein [Kineococcus aurantiacus]|uniref:hypothetical protein n=1 Tax=Kineococcus aurantiacus TaxID=37633 RepID=UPI0031D9F9F8
MLTSACAGGTAGRACTAIGPPFGLSFDMTALNTPPQPVDSPLVADYCADDICQGIYVRLLSTDLAITGGADTAGAFIFDLEVSTAPTAHLRLHDVGGPITREVSVPVAAVAVSADVNGAQCRSEGYWGAVRVEPDGTLVDVTSTAPLPASLQPR